MGKEFGKNFGKDFSEEFSKDSSKDFGVDFGPQKMAKIAILALTKVFSKVLCIKLKSSHPPPLVDVPFVSPYLLKFLLQRALSI